MENSSSSFFVIFVIHPCDDPYYPPNSRIHSIFTNERDALYTMHMIYETIHDEFEKDLKTYYINENKRKQNERTQFLRTFKFPDFINYEIVKYDSVNTCDISSNVLRKYYSQPHKIIFDLSSHIINPDLTISERNFAEMYNEA